MDEALEHLEAQKKANSERTFEIIIVNDGSKDGTETVALEYVKKKGSNVVR